ncbi:hypothetical protein CcaCcLH18_11766 [Colletotrichum camelliae]|nr:hypothetical protein CcaCcLH18_11766 [Colletotrichum camelliae]
MDAATILSNNAAVKAPMALELGPADETVPRRTPKIIFLKPGSKSPTTQTSTHTTMAATTISAEMAADKANMALNLGDSPADQTVPRRTPKIIFLKPGSKRQGTTARRVTKAQNTTKAQRTIAERRARYIEDLVITPPSSDRSHSDSELSTTKLEPTTKLEDETTVKVTPGTNDLAQVTPRTSPSPSEDVKILLKPKIILHGETFRWNKVSDGIYRKVNRPKKPKPRIVFIRRK